MGMEGGGIKLDIASFRHQNETLFSLNVAQAECQCCNRMIEDKHGQNLQNVIMIYIDNHENCAD